MELSVEDAKQKLRAEGYVILREKSYRQAQERQRVAESLLTVAEDRTRVTEQWARDAFAEQRRLADRLTHVYGVARAHGATVEELRTESDR